MKRTLAAIAMSLALAAPALAYSGTDAAVRPQDDLFRNANGGWLKTAKIPADKRSFGTFMQLRERSDEDVKALLEHAAAHPEGADRRIGAFYAAMLDLDAIAKAGLEPLSKPLALIDGLKSSGDVAVAMGELQADGISGPVAAYVSPDAKAPGVNAVYWTQSGLGLPDRDYYLKPGAEAQALRDSYRDYLAELFHMAGAEDPAGQAKAVVAFETAIATIQWSRVDRRDAMKTYNPAPREAWASEFPGFEWASFVHAVGMPDGLGAVVREKSYIRAFAALAAKTPVDTWKSYFRARLLDGYAEYMAPNWRSAYFRFKGEKLNGLKAAPPAWKTAVEATNDFLGEAVGERYVDVHFPPEAKARMRTLVDNLLAAYRVSLSKLDWMTPATRQAAIAKLDKLAVKIGYPDHWRGYEGLVVEPGHALANVLAACRFHHRRDMADAGKPVDRTRWGMTPQTVNAYYNPTTNEIVFPAAILQPPFFDLKGDDATNYGAIGAVIGHEISHGFDDQGRRYDGTGTLRDWWTDQDAKAFEARTAKLVAQYDAYEPLPGAHVNGKLTLGENIADLAGVSMAYRAYQRSLDGKKPPVVDGQTAAQRFFYGYARVWRSVSRPEWLKVRLVSDPHSPEQFRTNGVVTNLDVYYDAFGLKPGDKLYKAPKDRVRIW